MLSSREIRQKYLEFFASKAHKVIPSESLLPKDDPTVLFNTAGMQPLVPYLMGKPHPDGKRLVDVQKCVRTGDIDEVGDNRHLTFFEMLGNWSLGDYFKKEMITWSYEFLTKHLEIPNEKLWITVFGGDEDIALDEESMEIWKQQGVPAERIVPIGPEPASAGATAGKKGRGDNFWGPAGKSGPCGPCTEMYLYVGAGEPKEGQTPATDEENFIEVWNDVFMEYNQDEAGNLTKLSQQNVDTGMGLERITMVLNKKPTVFETDVFEKIFAAIQSVANKKYPPYAGDTDETNPTTRAMRVIADHVRSVTHIIADGAVPSNEGQGYVLRRLIRRAVRFGKKLGIEKPFLSAISKAHIQDFAEFYPELKEREKVVLDTIHIEEEKFLETLERGEKILDEILSKKPKTISGADAFKLFDTYGFPFDLTKEIAAEQRVEVDETGFQKEMELQKERARKGSEGFFDRKNVDRSGFEKLSATKFVGYDQNEAKATILFLQSVETGSVGIGSCQSLQVEFALDTTPFYAEAGGQVADIGTVESNGNIIKVLDVQKLPNGVFVHTGEIIQGEVNPDDEVLAKINVPRREQIRRHHSLAHLLQAALLEVLGDHVQQQGSLVTPERTRFDFSHPKAVSPEQIRKVELFIMKYVTAAYDVQIEEMRLEAAKEAGAIALFSEKYGKTVRTIKMEDCSFELCGGTHVSNTAEIGAVKIVSEASIASGIRRVEVICAEAAQKYLWELSDQIHDLAQKTKTEPERLQERIDGVFAEKKELENALKNAQEQLVRYESDEFFALQKEVHGKKVVCEPVPTGDNKKIGAIARELIDRGVDVAAMFTRDGGVAIATTGDISANDLLQSITTFAGGNGGGGKNFAQGAKVNLEEFQGIREVIEKTMHKNS